MLMKTYLCMGRSGRDGGGQDSLGCSGPSSWAWLAELCSSAAEAETAEDCVL
jgi:hypothetical protein